MTTTAVDLLERFLNTLPEGHPERPGVIRSLEVLRIYGHRDLLRPPTGDETQEACRRGSPTCSAMDEPSHPNGPWLCTRWLGHDGPHVAAGREKAFAWWYDGVEAVDL